MIIPNIGQSEDFVPERSEVLGIDGHLLDSILTTPTRRLPTVWVELLGGSDDKIAGDPRSSVAYANALIIAGA